MLVVYNLDYEKVKLIVLSYNIFYVYNIIEEIIDLFEVIVVMIFIFLFLYYEMVKKVLFVRKYLLLEKFIILKVEEV